MRLKTLETGGELFHLFGLPPQCRVEFGHIEVPQFEFGARAAQLGVPGGENVFELIQVIGQGSGGWLVGADPPRRAGQPFHESVVPAAAGNSLAGQGSAMTGVILPRPTAVMQR